MRSFAALRRLASITTLLVIAGMLLVPTTGAYAAKRVAHAPGVTAAVPAAPTNVMATAGDGLAEVTWTAPDDGGSMITSYTVTADPGGAAKVVRGTPPATTATVTGLDNGTAYTFTVSAKNADGSGPDSTPSDPVTPTAAPTAPAAPTDVVATPGDQSAVVTWTAPADGGSPITSYTVTGTPGHEVVPATTTSALVTGLTNGTGYVFRVTATNAVGTSPSSDRSERVVPRPGQGTVLLHGDFNGDGRTDIAVWRASNGTWYSRGVGSVQYGAAGDVPVAADFNGDGRSDIAVWRPSNGTWYIRGAVAIPYGTNGDMPVAADYNGDHRTDIAVWRPSNGTWYIRSGGSVQYGTADDMPVAADYNGDGRSDIAVWRPSNATWYIRGGGSVQYGTAGDVPVVGDYTGDGRSDVAVWRPDNGTWYISGGGAVQYGMRGDLPV